MLGSLVLLVAQGGEGKYSVLIIFSLTVFLTCMSPRTSWWDLRRLTRGWTMSLLLGLYTASHRASHSTPGTG